MSLFETYLQLGIEHILDINARDHILFILVMVIVYRPTDWKSVIWIVTSFTIGHSLTLALAALDVVSVSTSLIEFLIAFTICVTAIENIWFPSTIQHRVWLSGIFGLIHGMGFSNFLKAMLGASSDVIMPLFAFNIGVEVGQLVILVILFVVMWALTTALKIQTKLIITIVSAIVALQSILWMIDRAGILDLSGSVPWLL